MAYMYDATITLKGNEEKLKEAEAIINGAAGSSEELETFLKPYEIDVDEEYKDATAYHYSLLAYIFCNPTNAKIVADVAWRDFIDGASLNENNELEIVVRSGSEGGEEFFSKLIELSEYLDSFEIELEEDDDDEEWDDDWDDDEE